jgi:O-antigen ligase
MTERSPAEAATHPIHPWLLLVPVASLAAVAPLVSPLGEPWIALSLSAAAVAVAVALLHPAASPCGPTGLLLAALAALPLILGSLQPADAGAVRPRLIGFALAALAFRAGRDLGGPRRRTVVAAALAVVGSLTALHGMYQRLLGFDEALRQTAGRPELAVHAERLATGRVFSTFLLPSTFAGFLLLSGPLTVWLAVRSRGPSRAAWGLSAALQAAALFLTYSHGAWVALTLALLLAAAVSRRSLRLTALVGAGAAVVLLAAIVLLRGERVGAPDSPVDERLGNWEVALLEVRDHPLAGVGWGGYGGAYTRYQRPGMNQSRYAHNTFLQVLAEGGLTTLPFLLVGIGAVLGRLGRRDRRPGGAAFTVALIATVLHNGVDFTLLLPSVAIPFFLVLGAAATARAGARWAGGAAALGLAVAVAAAGIPLGLAGASAREARDAVAEGRAEPGRDAMERAVALDPASAEYRDFLARWWLDHGAPGIARAQAEAACRLAPATPHHRTTLEMACLAEGDLACAWRAAGRAAALFPASAAYRARRDEVRELVVRRMREIAP